MLLVGIVVQFVNNILSKVSLIVEVTQSGKYSINNSIFFSSIHIIINMKAHSRLAILEFYSWKCLADFEK
jgi:hypothetical protein